MSRVAALIVDSKPFRLGIVATILVAGVLAGLETSAGIVAHHGPLLRALDATVIGVFVIEIVLKIAACGRRPLDYFRDGWNVFDFTIVALCLLPVSGPFASVLRLVRTLRLLRLVTALPKLQLLVGALLKSLSAMGYVSLLLMLVFYIYAVTGIHLFGGHAPEYFGSLGIALLSLFQMITLDNWGTLFTTAQVGAPVAATVYFVSFILLGTMIMLNLFIGVIMTSMAEVHTELDERQAAASPAGEASSLLNDVTALDRQVSSLKAQLHALRAKLPPNAV